jgi:hypothetical protein
VCFNGEGRLTAVDVEAGTTFRAGVPHALFDVRAVDGPGAGYRDDVAPDGKRFLVNTLRQPEASGPAQSIVVVMNWLSGVRK